MIFIFLVFLAPTLPSSSILSLQGWPSNLGEGMGRGGTGLGLRPRGFLGHGLHGVVSLAVVSWGQARKAKDACFRADAGLCAYVDRKQAGLEEREGAAEIPPPRRRHRWKQSYRGRAVIFGACLRQK